MKTEEKWIRRWNTWLAPKASRPGVWRRKEGGYLIRGRAKDPKTGALKQVRRVVEGTDVVGAYMALQEELQRIRNGAKAEAPCNSMHFADYAVSLLERKKATGEIASLKSLVNYASILERHLIPAFGEIYVDQIRRADIEAWRTRMALRVKAGETSPVSVNNHLRVLKMIVTEAVGELELERNPVLGVKPLDTSTHHTYTEEEPNSLTAAELARFLPKMREMFPQHFAMVALGFAIGHRPSTLRPLRRRGPTPDVLWDEGVILFRRSNAIGGAVMETTKTKRHQRLTLPGELLEILRWHVERLPDGPMRDSDLLFPSEVGGFRSTTALDKPFTAVTKAIGLKKRTTPRAMRRTFQDLARAEQVHDVVTRAISGHATEDMQRHYSTAAQHEIRDAIGRVVHLAGLGGLHGGLHGPENRKAS